ncbi:MAG: DUF4332 domain-containing protein [Saprospiraceae bacterium]|nr:DUF4332 domain-containing protein [Saprospiraceae bacterium]
MSYYIDLHKIKLPDYREKLRTADLLPSRRLLKDNIDAKFMEFDNLGIKNLGALKSTLGNKKKFAELLQNPVFDENYLRVLLREINSMLPSPNKFKDFPGLRPETISKLENAGIKNTFTLFDHIKNKSDREKLQKATGIEMSEIMMLTSLTDLSRIKWGSAVFVSMINDMGINSVQKLANTDYNILNEQVRIFNNERHYFKGNIGKHDIKLFVEAAKDVSPEVEY